MSAEHIDTDAISCLESTQIADYQQIKPAGRSFHACHITVPFLSSTSQTPFLFQAEYPEFSFNRSGRFRVP